ncbi:hypothetical protein TYRP_022061 [Tyrophagus putrescentiae]|nr:hypothetical protein TYRP_022061 [Tyrophagus putrescentiae]
MSAPLSRRILSSLITPFTTTTSTYQSSISRLLHLTPSSFQQIQTFVVCGPSGSGKTTLLSMLTDYYKDCFKFCVSQRRESRRRMARRTTLCSTEEFQRMISANAFVEWAQFSGNYYGTSYQELEVVKASNRIPILDVDIRGVMNLKKIHFFAKYIFVTTPSFAILERNLRMRGTESEETIQRRLSHAIEDVKTAEKINFDLVIVNAELKEAAAVFTDFVKEDVQRIRNGQQ